MRSIDDNYFNKDNYPVGFEPIYLNVCNMIPKTFVHFGILLPFYLPIYDGGCLTIGMGDDLVYTYVFSAYFKERDEETRLKQIVTNPALHFAEANYSYVEMIYVMADDIELENEEEMTICFDELLSKLNSIISSYIVVYKDAAAYRITKEMLPFMCRCQVIKPEEWNISGDFLFMLHTYVPSERTLLTSDQLDRLGFYAVVQSNQLNPFTPSEELYLGARRYATRGFYRESVIETQTAVETFLTTLFIHLLVSDGTSKNDAATERENTAYLSMVKGGFAPRIGGTWDINRDTSVVGKYYKNTYLLRNRVAHGGYMPRLAEVWDAINSAQDLMEYAVSLLRRKKKRYPDLQQYFL
jgi:hypothetical protein